jgi:hypothetical protein
MNASNQGQLISAEYQLQQQRLHENPNYGTTAQNFGSLVQHLVDNMGITHLLDYGAGHNMSLLRTFKPKHKITYQAYDPGVPEMADAPIPAQMVVCIDVLEHIEPAYLDNVLDHLAKLTELVGFSTAARLRRFFQTAETLTSLKSRLSGGCQSLWRALTFRTSLETKAVFR